MIKYVCAMAVTTLIGGCPRPNVGRIPIPGYGKVTEEDICGDSPRCDVQGMKPQPLLHKGSSRRIVSDPYAFVGAAFRPNERNSLYGPVESCGELAPTDVDMQTIHGTTKANASNSADFKAALSARLDKMFKANAGVDVQRLVERTFEGTISFDRTIYTLKDASVPRRKAECRARVCAQGRQCKPAEWAIIFSASIVTLSGNSVKTIKEKLVAKINADASVKQAVDVEAGVGANIDDAVNKALTTSVEQYRFAAFVGFNDTLDAAMAPTPPE